MRSLLFALLFVATGLGVLAGYQFSQRSATERELARTAVARDAAERRVAELERALSVARALNVPPNARPSQTAPPVATPSPADDAAAFQEAQRQERAFVDAIMNDPKRREAYLGQNRLLARLQYGDIIKRLDLPPRDVDALVEILAQRQIGNLGRGTDAAAGGADGMQQRIAELDAAERSEIEKLLGSERAGRFAEYRATLQARAQLTPIVQELELARLPLKPEQQDTLVRIFHEQTQQLQAALPPTPEITPEVLASGAMRAHAAKVRELQEEQNVRILEQAAKTLSTEQIARLRAYLQQQLDIESLSASFLTGNGN
jgi:hypothetical protein